MAKELLQDPAIKSAKSKAKDYRLNDGDGLYLIVKTSGAKWWRFDYTINSKRKTLSVGTYPDTSLKLAREKAGDARKSVAKGVDPSDDRKQKKETDKKTIENAKRQALGLAVDGSFEDLARKWLDADVKPHVKLNTYNTKFARMAIYVWPIIGNMPANEITHADVCDVIYSLKDRGLIPTARNLRGEISACFEWGQLQRPQLVVSNPTPTAKAMNFKHVVKHRSAIIDPKEFGQLLRDIYSYEGTYIVQQALRLAPLLFQRPIETSSMQWADVDFDAREWRPHISKTDINHIVPLSNQAIQILIDVKRISGWGDFVFPSMRKDGKPMSNKSLNHALGSLGYSGDKITPHGFRTTASTFLNEQGWSPDAIERQLAHVPRDKVRMAYNRAAWLDERRRMMQSWADYLDSLRAGAQILNFKKIG